MDPGDLRTQVSPERFVWVFWSRGLGEPRGVGAACDAYFPVFWFFLDASCLF